MTSETPPANANDKLIGGSPQTEMASHRTSLAFERTRMGADRTLMATVRTSLSLISFGFTIYKVLENLRDTPGIHLQGTHSARYFGLSLLLLGIVLLIMGIVTNWRFTRNLAARHEKLVGMALMAQTMRYSATPTFVAACVLLLIGGSAVLSIMFRTGPLA